MKNSHQTISYCEKYFTPKLITSLGVMKLVINSETLQGREKLLQMGRSYTVVYGGGDNYNK